MPSELDEQAAAALEKALSLMNDSGAHWVQGTLRQSYGDGFRYCSVGALHEAIVGWEKKPYVDQNPVMRRALQALVRAYTPTLPRSGFERSEDIYTIEAWNDDPDTTWEKVVKRFTRARTKLLNAKENT